VALAGLLGLAPACGRAGSASAEPHERPSSDPLVVRRGDFERRIPLTGEIDAVAAAELKVPRVPNGKGVIHFLAPEGAEVKAGDVVVELDSTAFVQQIKDRALQLSQAEIDLERQLSQNGVLEADKALDVERKRAVVKRAEVDADVPEGILPKRDYLEKQMVLRRARVDLEKAEEALQAQRNAGETDIKLKRLALEKLRRAVKAAEDAIATLTLRAPGAGTVILGDYGEERRKFQEGDDAFMGATVARVSSSNAHRVRGWLVDVDDGKIAVGMPARVVLDAYPGRTFSGAVREISPVARAPGEARSQAQRRVFTVVIELGDAEAEVLRPGLSARMEIITDQKRQVLLVPRGAVDFASERPRVLLASGGESLIALGGCNAEACVVTGGLDEDARVRRPAP
jgi:multidrug resistance efflux pump